jgi:hypothetical protein
MKAVSDRGLPLGVFVSPAHYPEGALELNLKMVTAMLVELAG